MDRINAVEQARVRLNLLLGLHFASYSYWLNESVQPNISEQRVAYCQHRMHRSVLASADLINIYEGMYPELRDRV